MKQTVHFKLHYLFYRCTSEKNINKCLVINNFKKSLKNYTRHILHFVFLCVKRQIIPYQISQYSKCKIPKLIIRHNIGPLSAANSRLSLLGQCRRSHRSSTGPMTAAFVDCLNLPTFTQNLAQHRPLY